MRYSKDVRSIGVNDSYYIAKEYFGCVLESTSEENNKCENTKVMNEESIYMTLAMF